MPCRTESRLDDSPGERFQHDTFKLNWNLFGRPLKVPAGNSERHNANCSIHSASWITDPPEGLWRSRLRRLARIEILVKQQRRTWQGVASAWTVVSIFRGVQSFIIL